MSPRSAEQETRPLINCPSISDIKNITRSSLGHAASVGDLYDARRDNVCRFNVLNSSCMSFVRDENLQSDPEVDYIIGCQLEERLSKFRIEEDLQLSLIAGLAQPAGGASKAIWLERSLPEGAVGFMFFRWIIAREHIEIPNVENFIEMIRGDAFHQKDATHVITGISSGADVVAIVKLLHSDSDDASLRRRELPDVMRQVEASLLRQEHEVKYPLRDEFTVELYGDGIEAEGKTQALAEAVQLLSLTPLRLKKITYKQRCPLTYTLMPLNAVAQCCGVIFQPVHELNWTIDSELVQQTVRSYDELTRAKNHLFSLFNMLSEHKQYLHRQHIRDMEEHKSKIGHAERLWIDKLAANLIDMRSTHDSCSRKQDTLIDLQGVGRLILNVRQLVSQYDSIAPKIAFVAELNKQGIEYFDHGVPDLRELSANAELYVFLNSKVLKLKNLEVWQAHYDCLKQLAADKLASSRPEKKIRFIYVDDAENHLDIKEGEVLNLLRHYRNGECVCEDVLAKHIFLSGTNAAESSNFKTISGERPPKRVPLEIECPCSPHSQTKLSWNCKQCLEQLEYGFDDFFYCACGKAPATTFAFKCSAGTHGMSYINYTGNTMHQQLSNIPPPAELNILLLGETGVGKSTWINGLANYLSFASLDEAQKNETVCLIPSSFTMTDENSKEVLIQTGNDKNEDYKTGQSSTQLPQTYVFRYGKTEVRLIDTPGIGDTRGIEQDKKNMQHIMSHIANLELINGICVLLKPNNARLSVMFSFCIKELLTHLHRDACKNIVFCFTNARATFYRVGDTGPALRSLLEANQDIKIKFDKDTTYCVDNESVRFLAAVKHGIEFSEVEHANYAVSWEKSVVESKRMFDYIAKLMPHKVKNTVSLNDARRLIVEVSRPLAEISAAIQSNIGLVEQRQSIIINSKQSIEELKNSNDLYIPVIDLEFTDLAKPRTVCTSPKCVEHVVVGNGIGKVDYVKHCHPVCGISGTESNTVNCVALQRCSAMGPGPEFNCKICGCSWNTHMHITYECKRVAGRIENQIVVDQINLETNALVEKQRYVDGLKMRIKQLEEEQKKLTEVSAKFACFLRSYAIAAYNDALADYLDHLISVEKGKVAIDGDMSVLDGLQTMRERYREEIKIFERAIKESTTLKLPTPDEIKKLVESLFDLEISGPMLKDALRVAEESASKAAQYQEKRVDPFQTQKRIKFQAMQQKTSLKNPQIRGSHAFFGGDKWEPGLLHGYTMQQSPYQLYGHPSSYLMSPLPASDVRAPNKRPNSSSVASGGWSSGRHSLSTFIGGSSDEMRYLPPGGWYHSEQPKRESVDYRQGSSLQSDEMRYLPPGGWYHTEQPKRESVDYRQGSDNYHNPQQGYTQNEYVSPGQEVHSTNFSAQERSHSGSKSCANKIQGRSQGSRQQDEYPEYTGSKSGRVRWWHSLINNVLFRPA